MIVHISTVLPESKPFKYIIPLGNKIVGINLHEVDIYFENDRFIYVIDAIVVKSKHTSVKEELNKLNNVSHLPLRQLLHDNYFVVVIDKVNQEISLLRDIVGLKTGYFCAKEDFLIISTIVHDIAMLAGIDKFNNNAVYQVLYSGYLLDGFTIYEQVFEVKIGRQLRITTDLDVTEIDVQKINFATQDNKYDLDTNIKILRNEIVKAHQGCLSEKNIILLSGGLDSATMLVALDDISSKENILCNAFRVKNTDQDETIYAQAAADFLNVENRIIEVDPDDESTYENFEQKLLKMNNPYEGVWIFGNFLGSVNEMFYAGQDTRLHTPALSLEDKWAFSLVRFNKNLLYNYVIKPIVSLVRNFLCWLNFDTSPHRSLRGAAKFLSIFDINTYINKYHLKLNKKKIQKIGLNTSNYEKYLANFSLDFEHFQSKRDLYNQIVAVRWQQQYISDIRYIQDLARINNTYIAMPFYDAKLAEFSSSIPYDIATKIFIGQAEHSSEKKLINKYILREAVRDKIPDKIYYRDKGGSQTCHLMYNGFLGKKVRDIFLEDLESNNSFIKQFNLNSIVDIFLNKKKWEINSEDILLTCHYICSFCIYNKFIINKNSRNHE